MTFTNLKKEILKRAKESACKDQFQRAEKTKNFDELLQVVIDNFNWCYSRKVIDPTLLDHFGEKRVNDAGIYYKGEIERLEGKTIIALCGDVIIKMLDNSQVGEMLDSSQVGEMFGNCGFRGSEKWKNCLRRKI